MQHLTSYHEHVVTVAMQTRCWRSIIFAKADLLSSPVAFQSRIPAAGVHTGSTTGIRVKALRLLVVARVVHLDYMMEMIYPDGDTASLIGRCDEAYGIFY